MKKSINEKLATIRARALREWVDMDMASAIIARQIGDAWHKLSAEYVVFCGSMSIDMRVKVTKAATRIARLTNDFAANSRKNVARMRRLDRLLK